MAMHEKKLWGATLFSLARSAITMYTVWSTSFGFQRLLGNRRLGQSSRVRLWSRHVERETERAGVRCSPQVRATVTMMH